MMYSGKDAVNSAYPTQWALNPNAYQNIDCSQVDWAALAQQWIAMKESTVMVSAPVPPQPSKPEVDEEGEAPMEVENPDNGVPPPGIPAGAEWNAATNSWGGAWNNWGWGWPGGVDPKIADPSIAMMDGYSMSTEAATSGYTTGTVPAPTFQHGYWTAPQVEQNTNSRPNNSARDRRSKSKTRENRPVRPNRTPREKPVVVAPTVPIEPLFIPPLLTPTIDAAKRRQLPAWIREGLEKMEREKQRAIEREEEKRANEEAERERKRLEEEELQRMKAENSGEPVLPVKSKFESESEDEAPRAEAAADKQEPPARSKEDIMQEVMLAVRRSLTEILLEVTDHEIHSVSQEELQRYTQAQASRLNAIKATKSKALASIASGLGLGAYESSSGESEPEDDHEDLTDHQLQEIIRRRRQEWERTARLLDAEGSDHTPAHSPAITHSETPPRVKSESPDRGVEHRPAKGRRNSHKSVDKVDGIRRLDSIPEEKEKKRHKHHRTPSPPARSKNNHKQASTSSSDTERDSSTQSSDESVQEKTETKRAKKRKRSSSEESRKKHKKDKHKKSHKEEKIHKHESKSKRKDDHEKYKKSRDHDRYRDRYSSEDDRSKKRSRRSSSHTSRSRRSRERSRSRRRDHRDPRDDRDHRDHDRDHRDHDRDHRDHDHDRDHRDHSYDRYDRGREDRRSHSRSRHRR